MVEEESMAFVPQHFSTNLQEDQNLSDINNQLLKNQGFNRKDYDRMLAKHLNRLNSFNFVSQEEKLEVHFKIGEIYYRYAHYTQKLREKAAFLEQAKIHFEASKFLKAKPYLEKIGIFDETYEY